ncbi:MAG: V4R domain-containing protein [Thermoproteota archaeon]
MREADEASSTREEWKTIDLSRMIMDFDRKVYFVSLNLANESGALASFLNILKKYDLNLIGILSESISRKEEVEISMFLETPVEMERKELEKIIREEIDREKIDVVKEVKIFGHSEGFDADVYHFPLTVGNMRAVIFPLPVLEGFIIRLKNSFDPLVVQTILWYQGREIGERIMESYRESGLGAHAVEMLKVRALSLGWTRMKILQLDREGRKAVVRLFDNWECSMFKDSNVPRSHFLRGILAGFFSSLFGVEVEATEVTCTAKGDPYCEFVLEERGKGKV